MLYMFHIVAELLRLVESSKQDEKHQSPQDDYTFIKYKEIIQQQVTSHSFSFFQCFFKPSSQYVRMTLANFRFASFKLIE